MAVLIFRRPMHAQAPIPYGRWLRDLDAPVVFFSLGRTDEDAFAHVEEFHSFDDHGLAEIRAVRLAERFPFSHVFAQSEHDILKAARLRERFDLPGQSCDGARAYRDKVYMKSLAQADGIRCARFRALETPSDLRVFIRENGFPCVVKPRSGAGSRDVRVLRSDADLKRFLQRPLPEHYMVESFVRAPVYHVDGLTQDGEILFGCASRYFNDCLSFQTGTSSGSFLLDPGKEISKRLVAEAQKVIVALPPSTHLAFHAEFFVDADGILLCEIACRPGGSRIVEMIEIAYGVNLYRQWLRRSLDLATALPPLRRWRPVGRLLVPPRPLRLRSLPATVPFEWVLDYRPNAAPGQLCEMPDSSGANVASFLVTGSDETEVVANLLSLDAWFCENTKWDDAPCARLA